MCRKPYGMVMIMIVILSFEVSIGADVGLLFKKVVPIVQRLVENNDYGAEFESIGIIPTIMSDRFLDGWKERRYISFIRKEADIRLFIDYNKYVHADDEGKILLYLKCIVDSIMVIEKRKRSDFQGIKLISDILHALKVKKEDLENL